MTVSDKTSPVSEQAGRQGNAALLFLVVTAFINSMGIGLTTPVMPALLMEISAGDLAEASRWGGLALFAYAIMQFVFTPIIGALSDRFGRRPVLLLSLSAFALDMLILGFVGTIWGFILLRAFAGVFAATFSTSNAYIADVTPAEDRGKKFAMLGAAFGAGFVFGPAIGGALGDIDVRLPFFAGAALATANALYGYFVMRESLRLENRRPFSWRRANTVGTLLRLFRNPAVGPLLPVFFLATLSTWVYPTVWSYVAIQKFAWTEGQIGYSIAYYGVVAFVGQALVIQFLLPKLGVRHAIWIALLVEALALTGLGLATAVWMVYLMISAAILSVMQDPALRQEMSARISEDAQGELQGGLSALSSVAMILSPLIYMGLFTATADPESPIYLPGSPFFAAAAMSLFALIAYGWVTKRRRPAPGARG
ncbi:MAG: MFS transporter [Xanthomonadales bacterium]|nr:MFS transporter [Xanthomonadales bacterium]